MMMMMPSSRPAHCSGQKVQMRFLCWKDRLVEQTCRGFRSFEKQQKSNSISRKLFNAIVNEPYIKTRPIAARAIGQGSLSLVAYSSCN